MREVVGRGIRLAFPNAIFHVCYSPLHIGRENNRPADVPTGERGWKLFACVGVEIERNAAVLAAFFPHLDNACGYPSHFEDPLQRVWTAAIAYSLHSAVNIHYDEFTGCGTWVVFDGREAAPVGG